MVYLGPIEMRHLKVKSPALRLAPVKAVSAYAKEQSGIPIAGTGAEASLAGDRRKQRDRRHKAQDAMLETRAGRDRRRAKSINISV